QAKWPEKFLIWANLTLASKVVFWGYSEGGSASAWAAELAPSYARELKYVGSASGGIPADILAVGKAINTPGNWQNQSFGVVIATGIGYKAAYPELTLENELTDPGKQLLADVKKQCLFEFFLNNFWKGPLDKYMKDRPGQAKFDVFTDPQWLQRFEENRLGKTPPKMPTYLYQARSDQAVEYCQARKLAKTYCDNNVHVTWQPLDGEHAVGWTLGLDKPFEYVKSRLKGGTTANSCAALRNPDPSCPGQ
ncbi:MAG: lipase family protein, partial [Polyangiales bacterium]